MALPVDRRETLADLTTGELLALSRGILGELRRRGVIRSGNAPAGDYAELLVQRATGGELAPNAQKSWDVETPANEHLQVKARVVPNPRAAGERQLSVFRSWDFDAAVIVLFDNQFRVWRAAYLPVAVLQQASRYIAHVSGFRVMATDVLLDRGEIGRIVYVGLLSRKSARPIKARATAVTSCSRVVQQWLYAVAGLATSKQDVGQRGEKAVCTHVPCPRCGRTKQFRPLPANFECVDVICKFCGFLAQVKATSASTPGVAPSTVLGAAWRPQHERIIGGIFHALYVVTFEKQRLIRIDYVPSHMLGAFPGVFKPRKKLSESARRAGWQGFVYDLRELPPVAMQQVYPAGAT